MALAAGLRRTLTARFAAWIRHRQGEDSLPVTITRRRLYILPTRAGLGFALLLFAMLLAALNYANSLALFLTFLLAGLALAAMQLCHGNLLGARVVAARIEPAFAGSEAKLELIVEASGGTRHEWRLALPEGGQLRVGEPVQVPAGAGTAARLELPGTRRGVFTIERVRLSTQWPFGLFEAWTWLHLPLERIVYPAARGTLPPRGGAGRHGGAHAGDVSGDDEWHGLRAYRDGDSPRHVAWKTYARGAPLLVSEYAASGSEPHEFDFARLAPLDTETRLRQLCRWIVDAEQRGEPWALRLPQEFIPAGAGALHRHRCLTALARVPA